ncbi:CPBP family intramembrane metalloprotease [Halorarum halophilum]|uniref:CPBP family intramembrane metalloprotease n=1 Tax=Halorarum halophilum TaxID=2743090 RepID=A0A7D5GL42_9EURY|nr:type II CAAX endopeptidase family protein [Halobaculum halophilum]QLG27787.1 CPBP family intramembrane metalloprotease [Halobaculum halophilum]
MVTLSPRSRSLAVGYGLGIGGGVLAFLLTLPAALGLALVGVSSTAVLLVVSFVFGQYLPFMGLPLVYFRRIRGMSWVRIRSYLGVRVPSLSELGVVVAGFFTILGLALGTIYLVTQVLGLTPAENSAGQLAQEQSRLIPLFIVASLVVIGPCEETLFRGTVQNRLRESFSAPVAITLTAILFASIHVMALVGGLEAIAVSIGILLVPSFVFGIVYEYTENLVVPALIHGIWNAFIFTSLYISIEFGQEGGAAAVLLSLLG